jgi:ATP-dependent RNA helicase DeaD
LVRDHLGARPEAAEEATAARRARAPASTAGQGEPPQERAPDAERPRFERDERGPRRGFDRPRRGRRRSELGHEPFEYKVEPFDAVTPPPDAEATPPESEPGHAPAELDGDEASASDAEDLAEVYVNVGRRDGAQPGDFHAALKESGLGPEATDYVRVRHRHSFVGTRRELVERVLQALNGATIAGKQAVAEIARPRA